MTKEIWGTDFCNGPTVPYMFVGTGMMQQIWKARFRLQRGVGLHRLPPSFL